MTTHMMIDIETLGQYDDAHILEIGAVTFDPFRPADDPLGGCLRLEIDAGSQSDRRIDYSTVMWWLQQSDHARMNVTIQQDAIPLPAALRRLSTWYEAEKCTAVWARPSIFDLGILRHAYDRHRIPMAWHRQELDARTLLRLLPRDQYRKVMHLIRDQPLAHNALVDAAQQARAVRTALSFLRQGTVGFIPVIGDVH